jgi:hypothetical protein
MKDHTTAANHRPPFEVLLDYCRDNQITHRSNIEMKLVAVSVNGAAALYELGLQVTPNDQILQVTLEIPVAAAHEDMRPLVAEVVARANYRLIIGHFDLDMDNGRLRYRVGHVIGSAALSNETIMALIGMALEMADRYFSALMTVMFAGHTPSDAVYLSELTSDLNEPGEDVSRSCGESAAHRNSPIEKFGEVQGDVPSTLPDEGAEDPDEKNRRGRSG